MIGWCFCARELIKISLCEGADKDQQNTMGPSSRIVLFLSLTFLFNPGNESDQLSVGGKMGHYLQIIYFVTNVRSIILAKFWMGGKIKEIKEILT